MMRRVLAAAALALVLAVPVSALASGPNDPGYWVDAGEHPGAQCYKHEGGDLWVNAHGHLTGDGKAVVLNAFQQSWPGDHWELLVVKAGSGDDANQVTVHPSAGVAYAAADGKDVSHWIVCKGVTPTPTTTTEVSTTWPTTTQPTTSSSSSTSQPAASSSTSSTVAPSTSQPTSTTSSPSSSTQPGSSTSVPSGDSSSTTSSLTPGSTSTSPSEPIAPTSSSPTPVASCPESLLPAEDGSCVGPDFWSVTPLPVVDIGSPPSLVGTLPATGGNPNVERGSLVLGALALLFGWCLVSTARRRSTRP